MDTSISYEILIALAAVASVFGYFLFFIMRRSLPKKLAQEQHQQRARVIQKALNRKKMILDEAQSRLEEKHSLNMEELEAQIEDSTEDLETQTEEIIAQ